MTELQAGATALTLVPGDSASIRDLAQHFGGLADGLGQGAADLSAIESGTWRGAGGDAFRRILADQPNKFRRGAGAFAAARTACLAYAEVLDGAQLLARRAVDEYGQATEVSARWRIQVREYAALTQRARGGDPAAARQLAMQSEPACGDPGFAGRTRAEETLAAGVDGLAEAAARAAESLDRAAREAPRRPSLLRSVGHELFEFGKGAYESVLSLGTFAVTFGPGRFVVDPGGWGRDTGALGKGFLYGAAHPIEFGKAILDWDTWAESPARAVGHLAPDIALAMVTGGAGPVASRGIETAEASQRVLKTAKGISKVSTQAGRAAPLQGMRDLEQTRGDIAGGDHPPGFSPGDGSPAAIAAARQGAHPGAATDAWSNTALQHGDMIAVVSSVAGGSALGPIAMPVGVADRAGVSGSDLRDSLQAPFDPASDIQVVTVIRVNERLDIAASQALANPQHGAGGAVQIFIPDLQGLITRGVLTIVETRPLGAGVGAP